MARAREYLKKRKTTKINMAARLLSRFAFHLPLSFLSRTSVREKTAKNVFKKTLLSTSPDVAKLRSQFQQFTVLIAPTSEREGRDRKRRKSQSGHGALFMVGGFALGSLGDETPEAAGVCAEGQLTPETQPALRDEKGRFSRKATSSGKPEDRTRGITEWRTKRKLDFQGMVEDWSPPKKRETRLSQVWFKSCFHCTKQHPKSFCLSRLSLL